MTDREMLLQAIEESGLKKRFIAELLGITYQGFKLKLDGKNDFKESEMQELARILKLDRNKRDKIFFAKK